VYLQVSTELIQLFRGIFGPFSDYFDAILSLFNVLVHQATEIADFNYPYIACRKLLEGDNSILYNSSLPQDVILELSNAEAADSEFE
jgi:hypothetical protein